MWAMYCNVLTIYPDTAADSYLRDRDNACHWCVHVIRVLHFSTPPTAVITIYAFGYVFPLDSISSLLPVGRER